MTKKGLFVTLMTVTFAFLRVSSFALAPVISDPGDVIIGDLEQAANNNVFVFPDAIFLDAIVTDDNIASDQVKWSYVASLHHVVANNVPEVTSDPTNPANNERLDGNDNDTSVQTLGQQDSSARTVTFRNNFYSDITVGAVPGLGPYADPGTTAPAFLESEMITLYASDGTTYSSRSITVYTADNTSDSISGGVALTLLNDYDFDNNPALIAGWFGGPTGGTSTTGTATGLCMWVPAVNLTGGNTGVGWISPPNFVSGGPTASTGFFPLTDKTVYRFRLKMWTDETAVGAIPFWTFGVNNTNLTGVGPAGINYGNDQWILDVAGGANGINDPSGTNGRTQGRESFDFWFTPNAVLTDQWRGIIDNADSMFSTAFAPYKDCNLLLRILDGANNAGIHNEVDQGTVCLKDLRIDTINYDDLASRRTAVYSHPISSTLFHINPDDFFGGGNGTATIDDNTNTANFIVGPNYTGAPGSAGILGGRKSLIFYDPSQPNDPTLNKAFYPINWVNDQLLQLAVGIRSGVGGGTGTTEGTDPVDVIFLDWITPTSEIGGFNFTQIGSPGDAFKAASPRQKANTGNVTQIYTEVFSTQNKTVIDPIANPSFADSDRVNAWPEAFNNASLGNSATNGRDPFIIDSDILYSIDTAGFN